MATTKAPQIETLFFQVYEDGSGIAATYRIDGVTFGAGWSRGPSVHAVQSRGCSGSGPGKRRVALAEWMIKKAYDAQSDTWKRLNREMYAQV